MLETFATLLLAMTAYLVSASRRVALPVSARI